MIRAAAALAVGVAVGVWLDDPADRVTTVTEQVEVPGPEVVRYEQRPVPDSCLSLINLINDTNAAIEQYSTAVGPQFQNLTDATGALNAGDIERINHALEVQQQVQLRSAEPLQFIIESSTKMADRKAACDADMEDAS